MKTVCGGRERAFSLIELLVVVSIIILLAGMVVGVMGSVNRKAAMDRTRGEIAALETAFEAYRADYGTFPFNTNDAKNPQPLLVPPDTSPNPSSYIQASSYAYAGLCVSNAVSNPLGKIYFQPRPGQIATNSGSVYLKDPFGYAYGFCTSPDNRINPNAGGTNLTAAVGVSIWSTAGNTTTSGTNKWITNWDDRRR